jgi:predicted O-linked N-acetylglucosamine transferase (SPINDLY family)
MSDDDAIKLAKSKGINIAVDLGGYTENARISVFEKRVAPIQVSYLGYIGTLGVSYMDYILADREVIPIESLQFFTEKVVYLPGCFQINDRQREISGKKFNRSDFGLPEKGFVFCCFNHGYKVTPVIFESWCRILQRIDGSVLWLYESNFSFSQNLRSEAKFFGINPNRLVFGQALPAPDYLARYKLADLFLDTFPYNAGTTASDALWAGLPILTRTGRSFSSRMATSILKAIDIPELITKTSDEYESLAIDLASDGDKLSLIREKLVANRNSSLLFNAPKTTKEIERAYLKMYKIFIEGKTPESIDLTEP